MKAMILAAGLGTRLRPLTDTRPKALVEIHHLPLLEIVIRRLLAAGVDGIIINTHHFAEQIAGFLQAHGNFGVRLALSHEPELLDTGGGLRQAGHFFDDGQPFFLHNVDIVSNIDLRAMYARHCASASLATLAVKQRPTSRYFLFDEAGQLCGWRSTPSGRHELTRQPQGGLQELAFDGIHVISPALLSRMTETGAFSIVQTYLRLAGEGESIRAFRTEGYFWRDVGKLAQLEALAQLPLAEVLGPLGLVENSRTPHRT
ncbi:MAG: nucleotidyltransferase family protein [candidate division KSB1 bacterium]|nr:nucleotidyltransferase family protein [candidate division KSB1 bacterium]MDZ7272811.1 nucleotidyltransferase family protein [candidate division KSB1 bacterium]MDZ7284165.1 nucleotidyltransferase family protein [candidate division KSB1 bacterium]MDZ7297437.1 nucleotidyltransferase family protein [candidate division KSB1 bacterium]MDZ7308185.1 nucleotidyltransferase family protein [candidate division KSB1 bacterium]